MPSSHLILCRPLLLLPPIPPSIRVFSNESTLHRRWPEYWSFSFSISSSKEIPGLSSFRMDWLDLLAVQGTLKSLIQHHSSNAPILRCSAFFTVQFSHPYMTTGKTIGVLSRSVVFDSLWPCGLYPTRLLCPWGFSRQEYWSGLPCPPLGDLHNPGIKPRSPFRQILLPSEPPGKPMGRDTDREKHLALGLVIFFIPWLSVNIFPNWEKELFDDWLLILSFLNHLYFHVNHLVIHLGLHFGLLWFARVNFMEWESDTSNVFY